MDDQERPTPVSPERVRLAERLETFSACCALAAFSAGLYGLGNLRSDPEWLVAGLIFGAIGWLISRIGWIEEAVSYQRRMREFELRQAEARKAAEAAQRREAQERERLARAEAHREEERARIAGQRERHAAQRRAYLDEVARKRGVAAAERAAHPNLGHIYLLTNSAMPGLVKIGRTKRSVAQRVAEINNATGVPAPFVIHASAKVCDAPAAERSIHRRLDAHRLTRKREFFEVDIDTASKVMDVIAREYRSQFDAYASASGERTAFSKRLLDKIHRP